MKKNEIIIEGYKKKKLKFAFKDKLKK